MKANLLSILFGYGMLVCISQARAQNYSIDWHSIDGGGGTSTGGGYSLSGTVGQADAGVMSGGGYSLVGGFWSVTAVPTPDAPLLTVQHTQTNTVLISWPSPSTGFSLQQTSDLTATAWVATTESISDNGTNKFIIVNAATGGSFYRLFKP